MGGHGGTDKGEQMLVQVAPCRAACSHHCRRTLQGILQPCGNLLALLKQKSEGLGAAEGSFQNERTALSASCSTDLEPLGPLQPDTHLP